MGYCFRIGKAEIESRFDQYGQELVAHVRPVGPTKKWTDGGVRLPSYTAWSEFLDKAPLVLKLWDRMYQESIKEHGFQIFYPLSRIHEHEVNAIEEMYLMVAEEDRLEDYVLERVEWLVWAIREAKNQFGELAAFEIPGEWY